MTGLYRAVCSTIAAFPIFAAALVGWVGAPALAQTVIFTESFEDNSAGWQFNSFEPGFLGELGDAPGGTSSLGTIGFDYSAAPLNIPEAPNTPVGDAATTGARIITNATGTIEPGELTADQAAFVLTDASFAGKYTVQVDMWINFADDAGGSGTTEHAGLFVGQATAENPTDPSTPVQVGAGFIASTDGDCANCDYILLKNQAELDTFSGQYSVTDFGFGNQPGWDNTDVNTDTNNGIEINLPSLFPPRPGTFQQAGSAGFRWVTLTAEVDPTAGAGDGPGLGTAKFTLEIADTGQSFVVGTVDNSIEDILDDDDDGDDCDPGGEGNNSEDICTGEGIVNLEGQVSLTLLDFFSSVGQPFLESTVIFDNVIVSIEESGFLVGDTNNDGVVNTLDIDPFVLALTNPAQYAIDFPGVDIIAVADINDDGVINTLDIDPFVAILTGSGAVATPEPATIAAVLVAFVAVGARRRR